MKKSYFFTLLVSFLTVFSQEIYADNKLTVENLTVKAGEQGVLEVYLTKDNSLLASYQMDLELPDGFTIGQVYNEDDDEYVVGVVTSTTTHKSGGYLSVGEITKGVNISYLNDKTFKGEGKLLSIYIDVASTVSPGTYDLKLSDIQFSTNEDPATTVIMDDVSFTITVPGASTETEKITLTKKYNTYVPAKALDFSSVEGLTAYYVTAVTATEATLTKATTVAAGEGIILEGTADVEYDVPVASGEVTANSANLLATGTISEGDFILYDGKFVPCSGGTLPDGKAYLPKASITSSAKALILGFGDATGINEAKAAKADGAIYSISGVRVAQPQKGVYIMNGRKVIVK